MYLLLFFSSFYSNFSFRNYVLRVGEGIETTGDPQWRLVLCLLFTWILVFLCLIKGIKSAGKVVLPSSLLFIRVSANCYAHFSRRTKSVYFHYCKMFFFGTFYYTKCYGWGHINLSRLKTASNCVKVSFIWAQWLERWFSEPYCHRHTSGMESNPSQSFFNVSHLSVTNLVISR